MKTMSPYKALSAGLRLARNRDQKTDSIISIYLSYVAIPAHGLICKLCVAIRQKHTSVPIYIFDIKWNSATVKCTNFNEQAI